MRKLRIDRLQRQNEIKKMYRQLSCCLVAGLFVGCSATTSKPVAKTMPPLPPGMKMSARTSRLTTIAPESRPLILKWDYNDFKDIQFNVYSRTSFSAPWHLKAVTTTNFFVFSTGNQSEFFKVSAVRNGIEVFSTK